MNMGGLVCPVAGVSGRGLLEKSSTCQASVAVSSLAGGVAVQFMILWKKFLQRRRPLVAFGEDVS